MEAARQAYAIGEVRAGERGVELCKEATHGACEVDDGAGLGFQRMDGA